MQKVTEKQPWPDAIIEALENNFGAAINSKQLHGLSGKQVWLIQFKSARLVLKETKEIELLFYKEVAPQLTQAGVSVPQLFASVAAAKSHWITIEHIPKPLPQSRWLADEAVMTYLCQLHTANLITPEVDLFQPCWSSSMTQDALTMLEEISPSVTERLHGLQQQCQRLFEPACWISGDPNPNNWGSRHDNSLVLFDWERFGRGHPALDLAITVPGLGSVEDFSTALRANQRFAAHGHPIDIADLICAKAWTIVELLSELKRQSLSSSQGIAYLKEQFPQWIVAVSAA